MIDIGSMVVSPDTLMALAIPFLASLAIRYNWQSWQKALLVIALCAIAAIFQAVLDKRFNWQNMSATFAYTFVVGEVIYQKFKTQFKALEISTTPGMTVVSVEPLVVNPAPATPNVVASASEVGEHPTEADVK